MNDNHGDSDDGVNDNQGDHSGLAGEVDQESSIVLDEALVGHAATEQEIEDYARWLGMNLDDKQDLELLWIDASQRFNRAIDVGDGAIFVKPCLLNEHAVEFKEEALFVGDFGHGGLVRWFDGSSPPLPMASNNPT